MESSNPKTPYVIIEIVWQFARRNLKSLAVFVIIMIAAGLGLLTARDPFASPGTFLLALVGILIFTWMDAALVFFFAALYRGENLRPRDALVRGLKRIGPLLVLTFLTQLGIAAGLALLVIPGVAIALVTSLALPAFLVDEKDIFAAIRESFTITTSQTWTALRLLAIPWLFWEVVTFLLAGIAIMFSSTLGHPENLYLIILIASALTRPMLVASRVLVYHATRSQEPKIQDPNPL